jgi:hypothetical protein
VKDTVPASGAGETVAVSVIARPALAGLAEECSAVVVAGGKEEIVSALTLEPAATNSRPPPALGVAKWSKPPVFCWKRMAPVAGSRP